MTERFSNFYYFDYNATTPLSPEVFQAMEPYFKELYGNPSSIYRLGRESLQAIQSARGQTAKLIKANEREIVFTGSGTESNNTAIRSALHFNPTKKKVVASAVEHSSVRNVLKVLEKEGVQIVWLKVDQNGSLDLSELERLLTSDVALLSLMWANNETGVIFPIEKIAQLAKARQILFHVDAVQAAGKIEIDLSKIPIDLLSLSFHKLYGPKGVGALFVRERTPVSPLILGGHQERDRRAGTENVPGIVGAGKAAELITSKFSGQTDRLLKLRTYLENSLLSQIPDSFVNGREAPRISNTISLTIPDVLAEVLIPRLDAEGIGVSSGSACLTGALEPSFVLQAMGLSEELAKSSIRLSLGYPTTEAEIDYAILHIPKVVKEIRSVRKREFAKHG